MEPSPSSPAAAGTPRPWSVIAAGGREAIPTGALEAALASYRSSVWAGSIPNNLFDAVMGETFRQLFARGAIAYVAVNPAMPGHWLGLLVAERTGDGVPVVHAAYVKSVYRDNPAVCASLFEAAGFNAGDRLFYTMKLGPEHRMYPQGRFAPEIARRKAA